MNHRAVPFLRFILPFVAGLIAGDILDIPVPGLGLALCCGALTGCLMALLKFAYHYRWVYGAWFYLLTAAFGYYHITSHNELRADTHFARTAQGKCYLSGRVYAPGSTGKKTKIPLLVERIGPSPDSLQACSGHLLLFLPPTAFADSIRYGDRLGVVATVNPVLPPKNPHAFDYRRYLHYQNIHYQAFADSATVLRLGSGAGHPLWAAAYGARARLLTLLHRYFPQPDEYAVASALLVGYTDDLSEELRTAYAETGSMHALAVSGTHIGMLYVGLMFLIGRLRWRGRWTQTAVVLLIIWAFTFLTGATASVLRASVMFSIYMLGKAAWRDASAWNVLPASAFILLLYNPYMLFDVGFQLSYAAVVGMVFFYPRLYRIFPPLHRAPDEALKVLLIGVAAQTGTLPLTLFYFHQFPVYFWLSGWVVVFVGAVFLWGGALLILFDALWSVPAGWLGALLYHMIWAMNRIIAWIQQLPGAVLRDIWLPAWAAAGLYLLLLLIGMVMLSRRRIWIPVALLVVLAGTRCAWMLQRQAQQSVVVYSQPKGRLIDFIQGEHCVTLSDSLTPQQERFTAQPNRIALGVREIAHIAFADTGAYRRGLLYVQPPFAQFGDCTLAFIDDARWVNPAAPAVPVSVLVLSKTPALGIADCYRQFPFRQVIFDETNAPWKVRQWKAECQERGLEWRDVRESGAASFDF